jgi:hypothetical protein
MHAHSSAPLRDLLRRALAHKPTAVQLLPLNGYGTTRSCTARLLEGVAAGHLINGGGGCCNVYSAGTGTHWQRKGAGGVSVCVESEREVFCVCEREYACVRKRVVSVYMSVYGREESAGGTSHWSSPTFSDLHVRERHKLEGRARALPCGLVRNRRVMASDDAVPKRVDVAFHELAVEVVRVVSTVCVVYAVLYL